MTLWNRYQNDILSGITVAVVALPLALAFGIASGAGALAGLYATIFAGFVTSLFGGSEVQVSGPTGTMTVVLVAIIAKYGIEGMLLAGALAGLMQIVLGMLRLGRFVKFLPQSVISGFTNGVAIIIFMSQIETALQTPSVTLVTAAAILFAMFFAKKIPASLFGLAVGIAANQLFFHSPHLVGEIPATLPKLALPLGQLQNIRGLVMPAITICFLGTIESLLSAEVADTMTGQTHNANRELIGQGLGNLTSALVGGIPISGVMARTAVNVNSGGRTRLAGMVHSVVLLIVVFLFGRWAAHIPLASLAAILMVTAVRTVDWPGLKLVPQAGWSYGIPLFTTMVLTVYFDLTIAVAGGLAVAILFLMIELARLPHITQHPQGLPEHPKVAVVSLEGPVFFLSTEKLMKQVQSLAQGREILVLDCTNVPATDDTAILLLKKMAKRYQEEDRIVYVAGVKGDSLQKLADLKVTEALGDHYVCPHLDLALNRAYQDAS